jgi:hypothetical protein
VPAMALLVSALKLATRAMVVIATMIVALRRHVIRIKAPNQRTRPSAGFLCRVFTTDYSGLVLQNEEVSR